MTIGAYGTAAFASARATDTYRSIKADSAELQAQLATGKTSPTYAGLGSSAGTALRLERRLDTLAGYNSNVTDATLRVKTASAGIAQITKLTRTLGTSLTGTVLPTDTGRRIVQSTAVEGLKQVIDILNTDVAGRYLFSGRASDTQPVASYDTIINGDSTHAGLATLVAQRKAADAGPDGLGRLTLATSGSTVTLGEEAAGLPFGLKLASASATGTGITASTPSGSPAQTAIAVASQPSVGDTLALAFTLPDGSAQTVTLTAGATAAGASGFAIGATTAGTAANIRTALAAAIGSVVSSTLPSASALKASTDFFAGTAANPPLRIAGPPYETATTQAPGTAADTVIWYRGDTSASPRDGAPVRIGENLTIGIGAEADESAFRTVLASFGAVAADTFTAADATSAGRFSALATRVAGAVTTSDGLGPLYGISSDMARAGTNLTDAASRLKVTSNQIQDTLDGIETADPTEAATKLLANQTRLSATYQTTATIAKLSLVDYL